MNYEERLQNALQRQRDIKEEVAFLRLQIKQEKQQARWAKGSMDVTFIRSIYPHVEVENGAGCTYMSVKLTAADLMLYPLGWEIVDMREVDDTRLNSPMLVKMRRVGVPALLYITKDVC